MTRLIVLISLFLNLSLQAQWTVQHSGVSTTLNDIAFIDAQTGWVAGSDNVILKTSDGGKNWIQMATQDSLHGFSNIHFVSEQIGFATGTQRDKERAPWGYRSYLYKSVDSGSTWTQIDLPLGWGSSMTSWCVESKKTIWIGFMAPYGNPDEGLLYRTTDGGHTWNTMYTNPYEHPIFIEPYGQKTYYSGWNRITHLNTETTLLHSTDAGQSWKTRSIGQDNRGLAISPNGTLYTSGFQGVFKSMNRGQTWSIWVDSTRIPAIHRYQEIVPVNNHTLLFIANTAAYQVPWQGFIYVSENSGDSWAVEYAHSDESKLYGLAVACHQNAVRYHTAYDAWVCGENGLILHKADPYAKAYDPSDGPLLAEQNYPNPFRASQGTRVPVILNVDQRLSFRLYNALGRRLGQVLTHDLTRGEHWIDLPAMFFRTDGKPLPAGVYFLEIKSAQAAETLKLVLIH